MASWLNPDTGQTQTYATGMSPSMIPGGLSVLQGLMGNSGDPYGAANSQYQQLYQQAQQTQNPFYNMGTGAIAPYQAYNQRMADPSAFINQLMGSYQSSPYANFMQKQAQRANTNSASASGLIGSTPYQQQGEQYAHDISSQDQNSWLNNVLGVNTQYGQNLNNMLNYGANSANALTNLSANFAPQMGQAAYGQQAGNNFDFSNILGGLSSFFL